MTKTASHFRPLSPSQANARSWKPYPAYKPSGVEWLGDVPKHWGVKRLKIAAQLTDKKVEADQDNPVPYIGMENIESWTGQLLPIDPDVVPTGTANAFKAGHTLFGKLRPYLAKACTPDFDGLCSTELLVLNGIEFDRDSLRYALLSDGFVKLVDSSTYGSKMPRASWDFIGNCILPIAPPPEQRAIADFLDRETGKIDRLVAKKRELIGKLKEQRAALISHAVTRGLDPDAKLKPSGVEWLGDVPVHWEVKAVTRIAETIQTGPFGSQLHTSDYVEDGIPLINPAHIIGGRLVPDDQACVDEATVMRLLRHRLCAGDIIMGRRGEIGRCGVVTAVESGWLCGTGSLVIRLLDCDPRYFATVFSGEGFSGLLELRAVGTTMLNLNPAIVGRMLVPVPPVPEQRTIADFLDRETGKIDRLAAKVEEAIGRLQEYRAALITAAVTGKIDVSTALNTGVRAAAGLGKRLEYPATESGLLKAAEASGAYGGKSTGKKGTERENTDTHRPARTDTKAVGTQTDTRKALAADHGGPCASVPVRVPPGRPHGR